MIDKLIEIKDLVVKYHTDEEVVHAVNGINFTVDRGETIGIVGETGAGKTTTALAIMRLLPQDIGKIESGEIIFEGIDNIKISEEEMRLIRGEEISMIFQDPMTSLNPVISVGDQIAEVLELHKIMTKAQINDRVNEILELVGISPSRKNEYPHQFSGGMKQRVIIAMALACEPKLLIADEPTTALDVTIQAQVLNMIDELKEKLNTSMILITHDLGVVAQTCDRIMIMYSGEVIESGTAEDVYLSKDHHPYAEGLFGSIPDLENESERLKPIPGLMPDPTNLPLGCNFYPRCPKRIDLCKDRNPESYKKGSHTIKCHLFNENHKEEKWQNI